jgi:hypothetical protein
MWRILRPHVEVKHLRTRGQLKVNRRVPLKWRNLQVLHLRIRQKGRMKAKSKRGPHPVASDIEKGRNLSNSTTPEGAREPTSAT